MISQIIEARPEDLRVYLEEAAGISKYKERRKETETPHQPTRENLDRVSDVRDEVGKQLEHLQPPGARSRAYQALQDERRSKEAELQALNTARCDASCRRRREACPHAETRSSSS